MGYLKSLLHMRHEQCTISLDYYRASLEANLLQFKREELNSRKYVYNLDIDIDVDESCYLVKYDWI